MASEATIAAMRTIGREWKKDALHRIYFDDLPALYGLSVSYYKTGNVSSASLNGDAISNSEARRILVRLEGKLFFDLVDGKYHGKGIDPDCFRPLVKALKERIARIESGAETPTKGLEAE